MSDDDNNDNWFLWRTWDFHAFSSTKLHFFDQRARNIRRERELPNTHRPLLKNRKNGLRTQNLDVAIIYYEPRVKSGFFRPRVVCRRLHSTHRATHTWIMHQRGQRELFYPWYTRRTFGHSCLDFLFWNEKYQNGANESFFARQSATRRFGARLLGHGKAQKSFTYEKLLYREPHNADEKAASECIRYSIDNIFCVPKYHCLFLTHDRRIPRY